MFKILFFNLFLTSLLLSANNDYIWTDYKLSPNQNAEAKKSLNLQYETLLRYFGTLNLPVRNNDQSQTQEVCKINLKPKFLKEVPTWRKQGGLVDSIFSGLRTELIKCDTQYTLSSETFNYLQNQFLEFLTESYKTNYCVKNIDCQVSKINFQGCSSKKPELKAYSNLSNGILLKSVISNYGSIMDSLTNLIDMDIKKLEALHPDFASIDFMEKRKCELFNFSEMKIKNVRCYENTCQLLP